MRVCDISQIIALVDAGKGVLNIDELSTAPPAVQGAALGLVDERRAGATLLPPRTRVIACQNPPAYASNGFEITPALANRFAHYHWPAPSIASWERYRMGKPDQPKMSLAEAEKLVTEKWAEVWPVSNALFVNFVKRNPEAYHDQPKPDDERSGKAWPSPRTWDFASWLYTTATILGYDQADALKIAVGAVGDEHYSPLLDWVQFANLPDPEEMLRGGWTPDVDRLDVTSTALMAMFMWLEECLQSDKGAGPRTLRRRVGYCGRRVDILPDIVMPFIQSLSQMGFNDQGMDPASRKKAIEVYRKINAEQSDLMELVG